VAEQLGISRERVGSFVHEDLDVRKLSAKWVPKCLNTDQKWQWCQSSEQLLEFFQRDRNDFPSRLVTMDKTWLYHCDWRQSNSQWSGGIAAHPAPKFWEGHQRVLFLHDNAPAHQAFATLKKLAYLNLQCPDHQPSSLVVGLSDYHMFPGLKK
jgi:hypothetical protein